MRGQFYSAIAILIAIPIVVFVSLYVATQGGEDGIYQAIVADQIHQVEKGIENDFGKAVVTSGKRAMIAGDDYVVMSGKALTDAAGGMKELMQFGTIEGNESILMYNNTIPNWISKILAIPSNFDVNITYWGLDVAGSGAFHIKASAKINVSVADEIGIARIDKKGEYYEALVPIEGAEDPVFTMKTGGLVTRTIKSSPYAYRAKKLVVGGFNSSGNCTGNFTMNRSDCSSKILVAANTSGVALSCFSGFIIETSINLSSDSDCYITGNINAVEAITQALAETNYNKIYIDGPTKAAWHLPIRDEIDEKYYFSGSGPLFLKRLEGNLNQTLDGLETFVNLPELESNQIPLKQNVISVDYIYFGGQDYIGYPVRGLQGWFRLNRTFTDRYNLTELCNGC